MHADLHQKGVERMGAKLASFYPTTFGREESAVRWNPMTTAAEVFAELRCYSKIPLAR